MFRKLFTKIGDGLEWFTPPSLINAAPFTPEAETVRRARLTIASCLATAPLVLIMFIIRLAAEGQNASVTIIALPILSTILFLNPLFIKYTARVDIGSAIILITSAFVVPFRMYYTGGISSPILLWFGPTTLFMFLIANFISGFIMAGLGILSIIFLAYAEHWGFPPPHATPPPLAQVAVSSIALMTIASTATIFQRQRVKYETLLRNQTKDLAKEKGHTEDLNKLLTAMMDSVGQGFLIFNEHGNIAQSFSKACSSLLGKSPSGHYIWDVLSSSKMSPESIRMWLKLLFHSNHDFDNLRNLGPQMLINPDGRTVRIEYYPVFENSQLNSVVLVATDISEEVRAKEQAMRDRAQSSMILKMVRNNAAFVQFNLAIDRFINTSIQQLSNLDAHSEELLRIMHTIKGTANTLSMIDVAEQAHKLEDIIGDTLKTSANDRKDKLDKVATELGILRDMHRQVIKDFANVTGNQQSQQRHYRRLPEDQLRSFFVKLQKDQPISLRRQFASDFILQPVGGYFNLIDDAAKDVAERLYKKVKPIKIVGGEYPVDLQPYLPLFESFVHAFRNAIDHGIELPSKRQDYGKDPAGQLTLAFEPFEDRNRPWLRIRTSDDGAGMDPKKIYERAKAQGLAAAQRPLSDNEILQLVFEAGFSTKSTVSDTSGRGVGLDAIKAEAQRLGGWVYAKSELTKGSEIVIEVPELNPLTQTFAASA